MQIWNSQFTFAKFGMKKIAKIEFHILVNDTFIFKAHQEL